MGGTTPGSMTSNPGLTLDTGSVADVYATNFGAFPSESAGFDESPTGVVGDPFFDPTFGSGMMGGGWPMGASGGQFAPEGGGQQPAGGGGGTPESVQSDPTITGGTRGQQSGQPTMASGLQKIAQLLSGGRQQQGAGWIQPNQQQGGGLAALFRGQQQQGQQPQPPQQQPAQPQPQPQAQPQATPEPQAPQPAAGAGGGGAPVAPPPSQGAPPPTPQPVAQASAVPQDFLGTLSSLLGISDQVGSSYGASARRVSPASLGGTPIPDTSPPQQAAAPPGTEAGPGAAPGQAAPGAAPDTLARLSGSAEQPRALQDILEGRAKPPGVATANDPRSNASFIGQRGGFSSTGYGAKRGDYGAYKMNPQFTERLAAAGRAYEQETGRRATYGQGDRDPETQRRYWEESGHGRRYAAAPPGRSKHQAGEAMDIPSGDFRRWLGQNSQRFGLGFPIRNDPNHIQMVGRGNVPYPYQGQGGAPVRTADATGAVTRGERNNNPGNIKQGPDAQQYGATGYDAQGHAIFPSWEAGQQAQASLLRRKYRGMSIQQMAPIYAGRASAAGWVRGVTKFGGYSSNEVPDMDTPEGMQRLQEAIRRQEGVRAPGERRSETGGGTKVASAGQKYRPPSFEDRFGGPYRPAQDMIRQRFQEQQEQDRQEEEVPGAIQPGTRERFRDPSKVITQTPDLLDWLIRQAVA